MSAGRRRREATRGPWWRPGAAVESVAGVSLVEVLVALVLAGVTIASGIAVLGGQRRFYLTHVRDSERWDAARTALHVLSEELRPLSARGGDLYGFGDDSIAVRSQVGFGVICRARGRRLDLWMVSGVFGDSGRDSVLAFVPGDPGAERDDGWQAAAIAATGTPGTGRCPGGGAPERAITLDRAIDGLRVGTPIRAFRPYVYRLYRRPDGTWWLGRRPRYGRIQPVTGPLRSPEAGGLRFDPMDSDARIVAVLDSIALVRITLRMPSARPSAVGPAMADPGPEVGTISGLVHLRNR